MSLQPIEPDAQFSTEVATLGPCTEESPGRYRMFVREGERVLYDLDASRVVERARAGKPLLSFELAGPRERIFFRPPAVRAAIVTCGGLCPGLNDVIRSIVHELHYMYGVRRIAGVQYGYAGLNPAEGLPLIELTPDVVRNVHETGGSFLGSSRGPQPLEAMVETLIRECIDILFTIGGDGTLKGANAIHLEVSRRGLPIAVVGVPKTIDNDINLVSRTFGFETAMSEAVESIRCAHAEATGVQNGVGIVKLMGRESGFVAMCAALACRDVNFVLIPEVPFDLEGPRGLLAVLEQRLRDRRHAVIVVAEGAGQHLFQDDLGRDPSGNRRLGDIGLLLRERITYYLRGRGMPSTVRYIDPSYIIRSVPATPDDCVFCGFLGQNAVHAAMAGKTNVMVGSWANVFIHIPLEAAVLRRKHVDPQGRWWLSVLESTGQPEYMVNP